MEDQSLLETCRELLEGFFFSRHDTIVTLRQLEADEPLLARAWNFIDLDLIATQLTNDPRSGQNTIIYDRNTRTFFSSAPNHP